MSGLRDFHKTQCFFSSTIQVAALSYNIYDTDMVTAFMLIPLATNGVLPVVFAYLLLVRYAPPSSYVAMLTLLTWLLSTIVFWSPYAHLIPMDWDVEKYSVYQQFMYKLSKTQSCGGFSALAVCPNNMQLGVKPVYTAAHHLIVMTPMIWAFSSMVYLPLLAYQALQWLTTRGLRARFGRAPAHDNRPTTSAQSRPLLPSYFQKVATSPWLSGCINLGFVAGLGLQLSLLTIGTSLNMLDTHAWSFGQIVAVTIWAPPLVEYLIHPLSEPDPEFQSRMDGAEPGADPAEKLPLRDGMRM